MAARAGATSAPTSPQAVEIAIDTTDADRIRPFRTAVLAYLDDGGVLVDPLRIGPPVWFQPVRPGPRSRQR